MGSRLGGGQCSSQLCTHLCIPLQFCVFVSCCQGHPITGTRTTHNVPTGPQLRSSLSHLFRAECMSLHLQAGSVQYSPSVCSLQGVGVGSAQGLLRTKGQRGWHRGGAWAGCRAIPLP